MSDKLKAALSYAGLGLKVFPMYNVDNGICSCPKGIDCGSKGKHTWLKKWPTQATTNVEDIEKWWASNPYANVGVATFDGNEIFIIDIDPRHQGDKSFEELSAKLGPLPPTATVNTGGGGLHIMLKSDGREIRNKQNLAAGIDIRGAGGCGVGVASMHASGNKYKFSPGLNPSAVGFSICPSPWLDFIVSSKTKPHSHPKTLNPQDRSASLLSGFPEGGRDEGIFLLACKLRARGLKKDEVTAVVLKAAENCLPPFPPDEALQKVESAWSYADHEIELNSARNEILQVLKNCEQDKTAPFKIEAIKAAAIFSLDSPSELLRYKLDLKEKFKIPVGDLEKRIHKEATSLERHRKSVKRAEMENKKSEGINLIYRIKDGITYLVQLSTDGMPYLTPLCNFSASIVSEEIHDDGADRKAFYVVECVLKDGTLMPKAKVAVQNFSSMNWIDLHWGSKAILYAGTSLKDHLRAAIKILSDNPTKHQIYGHTGWIKRDDQWMYLDSEKALAAEGVNYEIEVNIEDSSFSKFVLSEPPSDEQAKLVINKILKIIEVAPPEVTFPLLAIIFCAPLCHFWTMDFVLFFSGPSGSMKSALTAVAQSAFGKGFNDRSFPCNWSSTANYLEKATFIAKDALVTIDDFAPHGTQNEVHQMHAKAERISRAQGNNGGRQRMRSDSTSRAAYYPRCATLSSGEDLPKGHSVRARMIAIELEKGQVDTTVLSVLQQDGAEGTLAAITAKYIQWLASKAEVLKANLEVKHAEIRNYFRVEKCHARTPDNFADLALGFEYFLNFAKDFEAITNDQYQELWLRAVESFRCLAQKQGLYQASEEPVERFITIITSAIDTKRAHLCCASNGGRPNELVHQSNFGWSLENKNFNETYWRSHGDKIGWVKDNGEIFLDPNAAYGLVQKLCREQGDNFPCSQHTLWKRIMERGYLARGESDRNLSKQKIEGEAKRVLAIKRGILFGDTGLSSTENRENGIELDKIPESRFNKDASAVEETVQ